MPNIPIKEKPCKSTVTKDFGCKKLTLVRTKGLCNECYPKWLLNTKEGQEMIKRCTIPIQKKHDDFKAAKREFEEKKSIPYLTTAAVNACHNYIKARDKGKLCASCDAQWSSDFDAGHFMSGAKFPRMKFDEFNIHAQCIQCNRYKEGNVEQYRIKLTERMGAEYVAALDEKARLDKLQGVHKWQREDLIRIRKFFTAKLALIKTK